MIDECLSFRLPRSRLGQNHPHSRPSLYISISIQGEQFKIQQIKHDCSACSNNYYKMGNCHKKDEALTVTNFDDDKWGMSPTNIHQLCFMLKNYYHPNVKLLKWISSYNKLNAISKWRQLKSYQFLPSIYESGQTRKPNEDKSKSYDANSQKRLYIVTEELIRLKDLALAPEEAAIIAFQSLSAYKILMQELGGFVGRESMIYISREGTVKVWVNQNLANNQFQFPHPAIKQEEFICSLLHQIFTRSLPPPSGCEINGIYEYLKSGSLKFNEVLNKLHNFIRQKGLSSQVSITKQVFDKIIDSYQVKAADKKKNKQRSVKARQQQLSNHNKLRFIVAESESSENATTKYVKDYSQKSHSQVPLTGMRRYSSSGGIQFNQSQVQQLGHGPFSRPYQIVVNDSFWG